MGRFQTQLVEGKNTTGSFTLHLYFSASDQRCLEHSGRLGEAGAVSSEHSWELLSNVFYCLHKELCHVVMGKAAAMLRLQHSRGKHFMR